MQIQSQTRFPLDDTWRGFGGLHGGLVTALLVAEADRDTAPDHEPSSVTTHFLAPVDPGEELGFDVDLLHSGRATASVAVRLLQHGRVAAHAVVGFAVPDATPLWDPPRRLAGLPGPDSLARFQPPRDLVPVGRHVDIRPVDTVVPGAGADRPAYEAWIRLVDPDHAEALGPVGTAAVLLDAMPPGLLALWTAPRLLPTTELTVHFAGAAARPGEWLHVLSRTVWGAGRVCVDHTQLAAADGRLVARATQTQLVR